jgi:hypothetical protein
MRKLILLCLLQLSVGLLTAQTTVTISVIDATDYASPVSGASVTLEGTTLVTAGEGKVVFTIPTPAEDAFYTVHVTKPDYIDYTTEWMYVPGGSSQAEFSAYINKAYSVSFTIQDKDGNGIEGADVIIGDVNGATDAEGKVNFSKQFASSWNSYNFKVSAEGYADFDSSFTLSNEDLTVGPIVLDLAYDISFIVKNVLDSPVEGAQVTLDGEVINSSPAGEVVFHKKINGEYSFQVSHSGFIDEAGSVTVLDAPSSSQVVLTAGYDLTLTIINGPEGAPGLMNDTITIGNITKVTGENGRLVFGLAPGTLNLTIRKAGFIDQPISLEITDQNIEDTIHMVPDYTVVFVIYDGSSYIPVAGATVAFNDTEVVTDENGKAVYRNVSPSETDYAYSVSAEGGYIALTGTVSLPLSSPYDGQFNIVEQYPTLIKPGITISLVNGWISYFSPVTLTINGIEFEYITGMGTARADLAPGTYPYEIIPADESKAILTGTLTIGETGLDYLVIDILDGYKAEIYAIDNESNPLAGAEVIVNGKSFITDESGSVVLSRLPGGDYPYTVSMDGYKVISSVLHVVTSDVVEIATLLKYYNVGFHVSDGSNNIDGATVELGSEILATNAAGQVDFASVAQGSWHYTVSKDGYLVSEGDIEVTDQDVSQEILLLIDAIDNPSSRPLKLWPNPAADQVHISLPGLKGTASLHLLNLLGQVVLSQSINGSETSISVNVQNLPTGVYTIRIKATGEDFSARLLKK